MTSSATGDATYEQVVSDNDEMLTLYEAAEASLAQSYADSELISLKLEEATKQLKAANRTVVILRGREHGDHRKSRDWHAPAACVVLAWMAFSTLLACDHTAH